MPSAKARAAKAATAARIAEYKSAATALESKRPVKVGAAGLMDITGDFEGLNGNTASNTVVGALAFTNTPMPFKPTLPSMLNLNTGPNMNRALAVGAVVVGAGQNGNPSDEENVVPGIASTTAQKGEKRGVDGVGYVARPLSPILANIDNEKDVRAYEFGRQKVKRAGELVKRKAAKTSGGYGGGVHSHGGRGASEGSEGDAVKKEVRLRIGPKDMDVDVAGMLTEKPVTKTTSGIDGDKSDMPTGNGRIEVSLSELALRQKKPRKVKEDDFEIISPVRSVIVLDDIEARDMDIDEPWEHVDRDFEQGKKPNDDEPSYAAVLLGAAQ